MNNAIKLTIAAGILAMMGCSDDSLSGAAIEPSTVAHNSSSSNASDMGNSIDSSIVFSTAVTSAMVVESAQISVYGEENGAAATCTADEKFYSAKMKIIHGAIEQSLEVKNLGSTCESVLDDFLGSCSSVAVVYNGVNSQKTCDENGNVKAFCYDDRANPIGICTNAVPSVCTESAPDTTVDFNAVLNDFMSTSAGMCNEISKDASTKTSVFETQQSSTSRDFSSSSGFVETSPDPVDSEFECDLKTGKNCDKDDFKIDTSYVPVVDPRQELPSSSAEGIDASANRSFIIKPNVETLNVSETERIVLDSLARAFPSKSVVSKTNDLTVYDAARYYAFGSSSEKYYVGPVSTRCDVDVFRDEFGLKRSADWLMEAYGGLDVAYLYNTILQYSDSVIVYLVAGSVRSVERENAETLFRTECESNAGSFYNYPSKGMVNNVGMACAVKNFTGISFDAILGQQASLCENMYGTIAHPVQD